VDGTGQAARPSLLIGILCGTAAALGWAAGFVAAKHGITVGFSPADLAFHRFFWSGLLLLPLALRGGLADLGGIGWGRGLVMTVLAGPPQAAIAYTGFILVPLGHGTTIQPACAALFGLILASLMLHERATAQRFIGGATIIAGLLVFGAESLATIGSHGVGGDLLFVTAGCFWATAGILLRHWSMPGTRAVAAVGTISVIVMAPPFLLLVGYHHMLQMGLWETALQIVVQGLIAGVLPIYLFSHAIMLLGGGRASTFPALVPIFALVIGYLTLGAVPSLAQLIGLVIVMVGFRFVVK
jgi:drug/metabolite transporter (DMT)-like permease